MMGGRGTAAGGATQGGGSAASLWTLLPAPRGSGSGTEVNAPLPRERVVWP